MWAWILEEGDVDPTGASICGGQIITLSGNSQSNVKSFGATELSIQPDGFSSSSNIGTMQLDLGTRSGLSVSNCLATLDISQGGVSIYDEGTLVKSYARSLDFKGANTVAKLGSGVAQVDVFTPPPQFELSSFGVTPSLLEVGQIANNVTLNWSYVGVAETLTINQGVGDVLGLTTKTLTGVDIAANTTWTITGHSVDGDFTGSTTLTFQPKVYSGRSLNLFLDEAGVEALTGALKGSRTGVYGFAAVSPPSYLYMCWPQAYGLAGGFVDVATNFNVAMEEPTLVSVTNDYVVTMNYYVYRSTNALGGAIDVRVM